MSKAGITVVLSLCAGSSSTVAREEEDADRVSLEAALTVHWETSSWIQKELHHTMITIL